MLRGFGEIKGLLENVRRPCTNGEPNKGKGGDSAGKSGTEQRGGKRSRRMSFDDNDCFTSNRMRREVYCFWGKRVNLFYILRLLGVEI